VLDVRLALHADLADAATGLVPIFRSVGPGGEAVLLLVAPEDRWIARGYEDQPGREGFRRSQAQRPYTAVALIHDGEQAHRITLRTVDVAHPFLQPLTSGDLLVVGERCRRLPNGSTERNGRIYGADGELLRELLFGDGIDDIQVGQADAIWVAYFDEGIFGNYGWGYSEGAVPLGEAGLVRFDPRGNKVWEYVPASGFSLMAGCAALNVADHDTWACYYDTTFPLVGIAPDGRVRGWHTDIPDVGALAVDGQRALFFTGYPLHQQRCVLAELGETALLHRQECRLVLPSGEPPGAHHAIGRGPTLHLFVGTQWYSADLRHLP
jgi:hypothetical protein